MRLVRVQEYSLSTAVEYRHPVLLGDAKLDGVAKLLTLPPCGEFLNPTDISIAKRDEFFGYTLSFPLFNGAASIVINAQGITVSFKQGRTKEHLALMMKLTLAAFNSARVTDVKRSIISFSAHAVFDPPSGYVEHMRRFTGIAENVSSGGLVLVTRLPEIEGELRYASERSLSYPNGLFFATNGVCQRDVTPELFDTLSGRFEACAALDEIAFLKT